MWNFSIGTNGTNFLAQKVCSVKLRKINIYETVFTSSLWLQSCIGRPKHLCRLRRRLYCWKKAQKWFSCYLEQSNFDMNDTPRSGRQCRASDGIWRGLSIMKRLRGTWPSLLNAIVNNFDVWRMKSRKNARVDDMEWFFSMTTPDTDLGGKARRKEITRKT
jgi:hypothetical protein